LTRVLRLSGATTFRFEELRTTYSIRIETERAAPSPSFEMSETTPSYDPAGLSSGPFLHFWPSTWDDVVNVFLEAALHLIIIIIIITTLIVGKFDRFGGGRFQHRDLSRRPSHGHRPNGTTRWSAIIFVA
jgi:hypothetical protein